MRTTASATSSVASGEAPEHVFYDASLRNSKHKVVEAPRFSEGTRIADTHAHLDMLHHPGLALARAAAHKVSFVVSVIDPTEDPSFTLTNLAAWQAEAQELLDEWASSATKASELAAKAPGAAIEASEGVANVPEEATQAPESTAKAPERAIKASKAEKKPHESALQAPEVRIIMGCHPHNASRFDQGIEDILTQALAHDTRVVGIGEVGLDYHYDNSPRDAQRAVFRRQIQLAHEHTTTITLHMREAHAEGLQILKEEGVPPAGVLLHCFNLDYAELEPFLELGAMVAYGGPLTFKKADEVREAAARTPLDRLVTETDCPFMAPVPVRGSVCEPASVVFTAALLAEIKGSEETLAQCYANAQRFFS